MKNDTSTVRTPQDIRDELKILVAEAETIMSDPTSEIPDNLRTRIAAARDSVAGVYSRAKGKVAAGATSANASVHEHLYPSLAIALGVGAIAGAIAGLLFGRRSS